MFDTIGPAIAFVLIIFASAFFGIYPVKKFIQIQEAKHELRQGSAGFFRSIAGWSIIAVWLAATWFCATITGDWWATGDISGAVERSGRRLEVLFRILQALSDD